MTKRDYKTGGTQASITPHASPSWRQVNNNVTARKYNVLFHINVAKRNVGERDASLSWTLRIDWIGESAFFSQLLVRFMLLLRPNPNWPPRGTQDLDVLIRDVCDDALQTTQLINDDDSSMCTTSYRQCGVTVTPGSSQLGLDFMYTPFPVSGITIRRKVILLTQLTSMFGGTEPMLAPKPAQSSTKTY